MTTNSKDNHASNRSRHGAVGVDGDRHSLTNSQSSDNSGISRNVMIKSKVVRPTQEKNKKEKEIVEFEENGQLMEMEVDDAGEFGSVDDEEEINPTNSDVDEDSESENETDVSYKENTKSGEILSESETETLMKSRMQLPEVKKQKKKSKRQSIEEMESRLDSMSSTLQAVKDLLMQKEKKSLSEGRDEEAAAKKRKNTMDAEISISETTIYRNVLEKVNEDATDPEITFNFRPEVEPTDQFDKTDKRDSS